MRIATSRPQFVEKDSNCRFLPKVSISFRIMQRNRWYSSILNKVTGRLLLEVAVKESHAEQNWSSWRLPEDWSETRINWLQQSRP